MMGSEIAVTAQEWNVEVITTKASSQYFPTLKIAASVTN